MSKLITVFGATGTQGSSVIRAILADSALSKEFTIRGITRDVSKPAARALEKQGIEVKAADLNSKESLIEGLRGSHTVFLVTTPDFTSGQPSQELAHGKNVADVASESGVQHLIYSSLLHVTDVTNGRLKHVLHFDQKAEVERYIRAKNVPSTFVLPGYFMSNFTSFGMLRKGDGDVYSLAYPVGQDAKFPLFDAEADMGKFVVAAIKTPSFLNQQILAAAGYYTPPRIIAEFEEVTGKKAEFVSLDAETYKSFLPGPMADEMLENHLFIENPGYYAGQELDDSLNALSAVGLQPTTWKEFLQKNKALYA